MTLKIKKWIYVYSLEENFLQHWDDIVATQNVMDLGIDQKLYEKLDQSIKRLKENHDSSDDFSELLQLRKDNFSKAETTTQ